MRGSGQTESEMANQQLGHCGYIGAINRAAIPGVRSSVGSFNKDSVGATIVRCNCSSFVQKPVEVFNANSLVVATSSNMDVNVQDIADRAEETFEGAAVINNNQTTETNFQKNFLDKKTREILSGNVVGSIGNDKASEVTHGIHQVCLSSIVSNVTGGPEIKWRM